MSTLSNPADWFLDWFRGNTKRVVVNGYTIFKSAPVWYAVNKIAGHVGQLPCDIKRYLPRGSETVYNHPAHKLMRVKPNGYQTPIIFKELTLVHALLWGNGRAAIVRNGLGVPLELLPLMPDRTITFMLAGRKYHATKPDVKESGNVLNQIWDTVTKAVEDDTPTIQNGVVVIPDDDVLHIQGLGDNGIVGKSIIEIASESIGLGLRSQGYADKQLSKGFAGKVMLEAPIGQFRDEAKAREFLDEFDRRHGLDSDGKAVGMLRDGVKANVLAMSNRDAQFVEMMKHNRQEVALWFLLESILGDDQSVSYNSLEQKNLAYLSNCLMRWLVKWEEQVNAKLLRASEQETHYARFNVASLLRSDFQTTVTTLANGITHRMWSPNEAREKLDMNPYDGGDTYENPAISPGQSQTATADASSAIDARMGHLLGVEINRILNATKNPMKFLDWLDQFYAKFENTLTSAAIELGIDPNGVVQSMSDRKAELLDLTGSCNVDGLATAVLELTNNWKTKEWQYD